MVSEKQEFRRKHRVLDHAEKTRQVSRACRYFGIGRPMLHRLHKAYRGRGEAGLTDGRPDPSNHPKQTPQPVVDKSFPLRGNYHLGTNTDLVVPRALSRHRGPRDGCPSRPQTT